MSAPVWSFNAAGFSDRGRVRERNEDAYFVESQQGFFVVADGLGGHASGEVASRLAVEAFVRSLDGLIKQKSRLSPWESLHEAVLAAQEAVSAGEARMPEHRGMRTTLAAAWCPPGEAALWTVHVGDSRIYRLSNNRLEALTEDHTILNEVRRSGALPDDPEAWPDRSILSQAIGNELWISPELSRHPLAAGDRILLCTDGLTDMLEDKLLGKLLAGTNSPSEAGEALVREANERGGRDNITVIVVDIAKRER